MNKAEAYDNGVAAAEWLKQEQASHGAIFAFLHSVLIHSMRWGDAASQKGEIETVYKQLVALCNSARN